MAGTLVFETFPVGVLMCNCTLLGDTSTGKAMVVDPGYETGDGDGAEVGDDVSEIVARLSAHALRLTQIVITHAHIDHIGGALALKRATGAPILLNQADLSLLAMMEEQAAWLGVAAPTVAMPDASADDGMRLGLSTLPADVFHTPGHTQGSICLHFAAQKLLLAGDTLFAGSIGRTDLPGGDARKIIRSIHERLLPLPDDTRVIAGHGRATTIGRERVSNPFLR